MGRAALLALLVLAACRQAALRPPPPDLATSPPDARPAPDTGDPLCRRVGRQTVRLTTDDGVTLEADLHRTAEIGGPVALLVHEIPPRYDRKRYPARFIDALLLRGVSVLNLDRRGAGGSGGVAREAYRGPKGWLDVKAARDFLASYPCKLDAARLVCVGASNGTTSCLDYAARAELSALVLLTGGRYTEAQHPLSTARALPALLVTSAAEAAWSRARAGKGAPPSWKLLEYRGPGRAGHGTGIFRARPESIEQVADFIAEAVKR